MNNLKIISTLYNGFNFSKIEKYKSHIIDNHTEFSKFNNADYILYTDELLGKYNLNRPLPGKDYQWHGHSVCHGIAKWYAVIETFNNFPECEYVMFADFDSVFLQNVDISNPRNYTDNTSYAGHPLTVSGPENPGNYDSGYFYYYCIRTGKTYDDIAKYTRIKNNSGLFIVRRGFVIKEHVDMFVDIAYDIFIKITQDFVNLANLEGIHGIHYSDINDHSLIKNVFTPFDEVFLQWLKIENKLTCDHTFNKSWNFLSYTAKIDDPIHVHCIDKSQLGLIFNHDQ
jgi:hypothetical protein